MGDTTDLPTSKAGSVAHYQAATVTKNVVARFHGAGPVARYDGKTICFIEAGLDRATFLQFDYRRPPAPRTPTKMAHCAKPERLIPDPATLEAFQGLASVLGPMQAGLTDEKVPPIGGLFAALRATNDPGTRRVAAFTLAVMRNLGKEFG